MAREMKLSIAHDIGMASFAVRGGGCARAPQGAWC